jgi:hypothetical protein
MGTENRMGLKLKSFALSLATLALLVPSGCGGNNSSSSGSTPGASPTGAQWTWLGGSSSGTQGGTYGTQGTPAAGNTPGGRYGSTSFTDASGNFWLFGGITAPTTTANSFNDLWKYSGGQWTWISGANAANQNPTYGTLGTPAPANVPGARYQAVGWVDNTGSFWIFGGLGHDSSGSIVLLNDLWRYSSGQWTWMGGLKSGSSTTPGVYGTQGTAGATNYPGSRNNAVAWTDQQGAMWLFGGYGVDSTGTLGNLNDLWKFNGGQWTWVSGANTANQAGNYGTQGTAAATNIPGGRIEAAGWVDNAGTFWLFGGSTGKGGAFAPMSDLWKYSNGQWTWVAGPNTPNQPGTYGTPGTAGSSNVPGARVAASAWADSSGNLWLFGGNGYDASSTLVLLSDLWEFSGGKWIWVAGSNKGGQPGVYGTLGTGASTNGPGGRFQPASWRDSSNNLWLWGGDGYDSAGTLNYLNDMWKYGK